jgi:protein O-mannosyl-transferase
VTAKRLYFAVAACAGVAYLGALWNRFALDDVYIVLMNPLVRSPAGIWRAFTNSYWAGNINTTVYRPLAVATFALDWQVNGAGPFGTAWFHAVNVGWHIGASLLVALLARRWRGDAAALAAGVLFAVHPVHVEAVANIVGRNELMAACFTLLALYAALERQSVGWTAAALAGGILSKENAAAAPVLIAGAWLLGIRPVPARRRLLAFVGTWVVLAGGYALLRWIVFRAYDEGVAGVAPVFVGQSAVTIRLTALAALADVGRLLLFPLHLQADYSPQERTAVTGFLDPRLLLGLAALAIWATLLVLAWRRRSELGGGRRLEAFGLGWVAVAYAPVANLIFPIGVLIAERTLYLPSVGLALAAGSLLARLERRRLYAALGLLGFAGGLRTALRVPVWRDTPVASVALLNDAPRSYISLSDAGWQFLYAHRPEQALDAFDRAGSLYTQDQRVYFAAAHAAFALGRSALADSFLARAERLCGRCPLSYHNQITAAQFLGYPAVADSLQAHRR